MEEGKGDAAAFWFAVGEAFVWDSVSSGLKRLKVVYSTQDYQGVCAESERGISAHDQRGDIGFVLRSVVDARVQERIVFNPIFRGHNSMMRWDSQGE